MPPRLDPVNAPNLGATLPKSLLPEQPGTPPTAAPAPSPEALEAALKAHHAAFEAMLKHHQEITAEAIEAAKADTLARVRDELKNLKVTATPA